MDIIKNLLDAILSPFNMQVCFVCDKIYPRGNPYNRRECQACKMRRWRSR